MNPQDGTERIRKELWRCFKRAGRGSIRRTQERLGVGGSYFRDLKRAKSFDLVTLFATLEILGEEPSDFFMRALSPLALEEPVGETPRIIQLARARLAQLDRQEDDE